jgi:hypothetical protein
MESNASTMSEPGACPGGTPAGVSSALQRLAAEVGRLLDDDLARQGDALLAEEYLALERLEDKLAAAKLRRLATLDARGAAGAEAGVRFWSTAGWLRARLRMSAGAATQRVRTARALHRGPLGGTADALADQGELAKQVRAAVALLPPPLGAPVVRSTAWRR